MKMRKNTHICFSSSWSKVEQAMNWPRTIGVVVTLMPSKHLSPVRIRYRAPIKIRKDK